MLPNSNLNAYNMFEKIPADPNVTIKTMRKIKQADFQGEWKYIELMRKFKTKKSKYDWSSNRLGSFLVKGLNFFTVKED